MKKLGSVIDLNRPFRFTSYGEENIVRRVVAGIVGRTKNFQPDSDSWYFSSGAKAPNAVKRNMDILGKLGLGEHSTVGQFLTTVRQGVKDKSRDLSWLLQVR